MAFMVTYRMGAEGSGGKGVGLWGVRSSSFLSPRWLKDLGTSFQSVVFITYYYLIAPPHFFFCYCRLQAWSYMNLVSSPSPNVLFFEALCGTRHISKLL